MITHDSLTTCAWTSCVWAYSCGSHLTKNRHYTCAVKRRWSTAGESPARELVRSTGSNRSGGGGNEAVGASGETGREGDLASMQAVTGVNAEQASKRLMQEPTHRVIGEGRR